MPIEFDPAGLTEALAARAAAAVGAGEEATLTGAQAVASRAAETVLARWHAKGTHTQSSPGEPPASITYELADSIRAQPATDPRGPAAEATSDVDHATYQEFGTNRIDARPFLGPAVDDVQDQIVAALVAELGAIG